MRVLAITNMWPTVDAPHGGVHVRQMIQGLRDIGIEVELLFFDRRAKGKRIYRTVPRVVKEQLRTATFDVIHVAFGGIMAHLATRSARDFPSVVSFCGSDLLGEYHSGSRPKLSSRLSVWCSHRAARRASQVIVKSSNLEHVLPDEVDRRKVQVIPNGVDMSQFKPADAEHCREQLGWDRERFHVLFPANMGFAVKRPELATAAVSRLTDRGMDVELHMLRGVKHADVSLHLNAADAVLLTSAHEGSPNIIKEALACDRPIVSVDVGDVRSRIQSVNGCYIADAGATDIAEKLAHVFESRQAVSGREQIRELAIETISQRISQCYETAIEKFHA
ncbi:MAG: hypothetical protein CMJ78_08365 [Planctomycetaceae bacterium]|nr:hypothetical protein [Planctomycetaceae bacterium]